MKNKKWFMIATGLLVAVGLIGGISTLSYFQPASAQGTGLIADDGANRQGPPGPGMDDRQDVSEQYLAQALGITEEQLQTVQTNAFKAVVQEALDQGLITQAQADQLSQSEPGGGRGVVRFLGPDSGIDMEALLAKELGITVDELKVAREEAAKLALQQRVADGDMTQEQADMALAQNALRDYLNPNTLLAASLGITTDELQAYRDDGKTMADILTDLGLTPAAVLNAQTDALLVAVQQAVTDDVITQAQADAFLLSRIDGAGFGRPGGRMGGGPRGGMQGGMRGGFPGGFDRSNGLPGEGTNGAAPAQSTPEGLSS